MPTKAKVAERLLESKKLKNGIGRKEAHQAVDLFIDSVRQSLLKGEKVSLVGFGTFDLKYRQERKGRNPRTNEKIDIPPKALVTFKPGKSFREQIATSEHAKKIIEENHE
jgi:nucleoid DNA-binding protein